MGSSLVAAASHAPGWELCRKRRCLIFRFPHLRGLRGLSQPQVRGLLANLSVVWVWAHVAHPKFSQVCSYFLSGVLVCGHVFRHIQKHSQSSGGQIPVHALSSFQDAGMFFSDGREFLFLLGVWEVAAVGRLLSDFCRLTYVFWETACLFSRCGHSHN